MRFYPPLSYSTLWLLFFERNKQFSLYKISDYDDKFFDLYEFLQKKVRWTSNNHQIIWALRFQNATIASGSWVMSLNVCRKKGKVLVWFVLSQSSIYSLYILGEHTSSNTDLYIIDSKWQSYLNLNKLKYWEEKNK